jgi:hypothetical protein
MGKKLPLENSKVTKLPSRERGGGEWVRKRKKTGGCGATQLSNLVNSA